MEYGGYWGSCRCWQPQFMQDNFLIMGYHAWKGFTSLGKGIVLCSVKTPSSDVKPFLHVWHFSAQFVAAEFAAPCLLEFGVDSHEIPPLMQAIASYNPCSEMLLLTNVENQVEINWLKNLKISPAQCYQQVCDRADEFPSHVLRSEL